MENPGTCPTMGAVRDRHTIRGTVLPIVPAEATVVCPTRAEKVHLTAVDPPNTTTAVVPRHILRFLPIEAAPMSPQAQERSNASLPHLWILAPTTHVGAARATQIPNPLRAELWTLVPTTHAGRRRVVR